MGCGLGQGLRSTLLPQMLTDLNTYLNKAIPDTRLTIKKYLDVKFEYLVSTCLPSPCLSVTPHSRCRWTGGVGQQYQGPAWCGHHY